MILQTFQSLNIRDLKTGPVVIKGLAHSVHHCLNVRVDHNQPCFFISLPDQIVEVFICDAERVANDENCFGFPDFLSTVVPPI